MTLTDVGKIERQMRDRQRFALVQELRCQAIQYGRRSHEQGVWHHTSPAKSANAEAQADACYDRIDRLAALLLFPDDEVVVPYADTRGGK